jgi:hypothetical protein
MGKIRIMNGGGRRGGREGGRAGTYLADELVGGVDVLGVQVLGVLGA